MTEKTAVFAPMLIASTAIAVTVNPRVPAQQAPGVPDVAPDVVDETGHQL